MNHRTPSSKNTRTSNCCNDPSHDCLDVKKEKLSAAIARLSPDGIQPSDRKTEFLCPVCLESNLSVGTVFGLEVCHCNDCDGFVMPQLAFQDLVRGLRAEYSGPNDCPVPIDAKELEVNRCCPACLEKMDTHPYYGPGNIVLDSCRNCSIVWLDGQELSTIKRAPGRR